MGAKMARKLKDAGQSGRGHNSNVILDEEDAAALQLHYTLRIRAQIKKAEAAKAIYDAERNEVNGVFSLIKGDLKIPRKEFEELLALQDMGEREFIAHEAKRHQRMVNQGLPVGTQLDMFGTGDTVDDQAVAYADGYRAGRRGDDGTPPETTATFLHPNWQEGWNDGVAENAPKLARATAIMEARAAAPVDDDDSDREEGDVEIDPAALERELKTNGFTERSGDEDDAPPSLAEVFPGADAEALDRKASGRARRQAALAH